MSAHSCPLVLCLFAVASRGIATVPVAHDGLDHVGQGTAQERVEVEVVPAEQVEWMHGPEPGQLEGDECAGGYESFGGELSQVEWTDIVGMEVPDE